ncbi:MAG TPA: bacillithiol biosynthesis deacetylase BshB1 [Candidatus Krumholzibacteria bacterium]|nr:bacillithiol biosynthesis deacetylase BshB1 [Candidatus Krumholzibacteria bacterium]
MRVLAIGIHPDDVEISCGGTVATLCARGDEVVILDLTRGESSTNGTPEQRAREAESAAHILGVARRINAALPDAGLRFDDPAQRRAIVAAIRSVRPHIVLIPNPDDPHPDHAAGGVLSQHAVFMANVDGYVTEEGGVRQTRWRVARSLVYSGRREVRPDLVVDVTAAYETKTKAIRAHATQVGTGKDLLPTALTDPRFFSVVEARDRVAGRRIGATFGEAFELLEPLGLTDFTPLVNSEE